MDEELNNKNLQKAIFKTVAFFDIFDYPLTAWEVYKFLYQNRAKYFDVVGVLNEMMSAGKLQTRKGFYFLPGRAEILKTRPERYNIADKKFKIVLRAVTWLRWLTNLKMVAVCNNLAYSNAVKESDLDVFIIVSRGKLWLTRSLLTIIVQLLGLRRHGHQVTDKICLSFYITDDNLNLQDITLEQDIYFYYWLTTLAPVYDDGIYSKFWSANSWVKKFLPNSFAKRLNHRRRVELNKIMRVDRELNQKFDKMLLGSIRGDRLEKIVKKIQLQKMSKNINSVAKQNDTRVIISDQMLKFHEQDRRAEFRNKWLNKLRLIQS